MTYNLILANAANHKIALTEAASPVPVKIASLSLMPDDRICAGSKAADCMDDCLKDTGRGVMSNVKEARQRRTDLWLSDRDLFLDMLKDDLGRFVRNCTRSGLTPIARLNVLSDIAWEEYGIPQLFPELRLYDYTKRAKRLGTTPENYRLMFSYSGAPKYQNQVAIARKTDFPIAVVFRGGMPERFLDRPVINGDDSDLFNADARGKVVGLRLKGGRKIQNSRSLFIVDNPDLDAVAA